MPVHRMISASIFAALMCVGSYIYLPIGPVPIVLNNFFVFLGGLLLGPFWGFLSVLTYLMLGLMGFPVFAGGKSGLAHIFGPTGGYLIGFLASIWFIGFVSHSRYFNRQWIRDGMALGAGIIITYCLGLLWLKGITKMTWVKTVTVGCLPFIPGDVIKACGALLLASKLRNILSMRKILATDA